MIKPLSEGDSVAILASARKVSEAEIQACVHALEEAGLKVVLGKNLFAQAHQFAGEDDLRKDDLQNTLDHPDIKAIIFARGGYGTGRILDQIDFSTFLQYPKLLCGFSDITALHLHINHLFGIPTLHSPMAINFAVDPNENALKHFVSILFQTNYAISFEAHPFNTNFQSKIEGEIIGGNLSLIYSLLGSVSQPDTNNKILFIEDLDEYLYHIDRMMLALKRAGLLKNLKALLVGGMSNMKDNAIPFGKTAEEIILSHTASYTYPVIFNFPAGHISNNLAFHFQTPVSIEKGDTITCRF
jgi:muramoyltetrapeptide carboxypeptidase